MVNLVWDTFENWIDNVAKMIPPLEQDAHKKLIKAEKNLYDANEEKKLADQTVNIKMQQKKAEIASLKRELKQATQAESAKQSDLQTRIELLTAFVSGCKYQFDKLKDKMKESQKVVATTKNVLVALKAKQGKPEASIVAEIELLLDKHKESRDAYHCGDFNGVCCRRLVNYCHIIMKGITKIILSKKDEMCDAMEVTHKMEEIEQSLGLLDAAFAYLNIIHPNDYEKQQAIGRQQMH
jgi:chromosome segregation ATPase